MLLLILATFSLSLGCPHLLKQTANWSSSLHTSCLQEMPNSRHEPFYHSILCGLADPQDQMNSAFNELGLIHLILVTSHHLHTFDFFLDRLAHLWSRVSKSWQPFEPQGNARALMRGGLFGVLVLMGGAKIYLIRSWIAVLLREINLRWRLGWRPVQRVIASGIICLFFCREDSDARSLAIGWAASLAFSLHSAFTQSSLQTDRTEGSAKSLFFQWTSKRARLFRYLKRQLFASAFLYLFLLPLFIAHGWPSAWIVLCNSFLAPILSCILFPLALLFKYFQFMRTATDRSLDMISIALRGIAAAIPAELHSDSLRGLLDSGSSRVVYLITLSLICVMTEAVLLSPRGQRRSAALKGEKPS